MGGGFGVIFLTVVCSRAAWVLIDVEISTCLSALFSVEIQLSHACACIGLC